MKWQGRGGVALRVRPWWRPLALTAATAAAIAALFNPVPALATPEAPPGIPGAVPDTGSAPFIPGNGAITMPGQQQTIGSTPTTTNPATTTPTSTTPIVTGVTTDPVMKKIEAARTATAKAGEQLAKIDEDVALANQQLTTANAKVAQTQAAVTAAQQEVEAAAASSVRDAAALPPGSLISGLQDLDSLARMQRGESATQQAAARQLTIVQAAYAAALAEQQQLTAQIKTLGDSRTAKQAELDKATAAQQKIEQANSDAIAASDAAEAVQDAAVGAPIVAGEGQGRSADPRAVAALKIALAQRGDPYVWSTEGPNTFDCSGLMFYSYRSAPAGNFPLRRVSRDQFDQTRDKLVDRYSLLPGDLLFFSYSSSWQDIHHVAMYAGQGMMVEAPRTGLDVRLVPVRWTRLFAATRIYGSVEGTVEGPALGTPDPETPSNHTPGTTKPNPGQTTKPPTTKPTKPTPTPSQTKPSPTPSQTKPSPTPSQTKPSPTPSQTKPSPTPSETKPSATPTTTKPSPTADPTTSAPEAEPKPTETTTKAPASQETKSPSATAETKTPSATAGTKSPSAATSHSRTASASATASAEAKQSD
ncbi:C40 family peptidase [Actinoplanes sp. N902-109]|uniref:C40 family peptidase n=1 Tax=Actinoplanes sp. (strain N902-109) TaxID=649831 RepID=UPI0003293D72|nr:C40 family peptidase [Actinoplanes sp. N902-109]AGL13906.1 nlp/p60 protein [Actinoplanes sp. N902-109]